MTKQIPFTQVTVRRAIAAARTTRRPRHRADVALEEMTAKLAVSIGEDKKDATESFADIFDFMKSQAHD
jgi:hypothetical protein